MACYQSGYPRRLASRVGGEAVVLRPVPPHDENRSEHPTGRRVSEGLQTIRESTSCGRRGGRGFGGGAGRPQRVPIYRLMKKANLKGELVRPFNEYEANRYLR